MTSPFVGGEIIVVPLPPQEDLSQNCGMFATWDYDAATGVVTIEGTQNVYSYSNPTVFPADGSPVSTECNPPWDKYKNNITGFVYGDGISNTCGGAYGFTNLKNVSLSSTVTRIDAFSFTGCTGLEAIRLPDYMATIEISAFQNCSRLSQINFPKYLFSVNSYAFYGCKSLRSVKLPEGFTALGYVEGYIDASGKVVLLDGGIVVNPTVKKSIQSQCWLVPPVFWEAEIKGEIQGKYNIYLEETAKNFTPTGRLEDSVDVKSGVGLGVAGVAGIASCDTGRAIVFSDYDGIYSELCVIRNEGGVWGGKTTVTSLGECVSDFCPLLCDDGTPTVLCVKTTVENGAYGENDLVLALQNPLCNLTLNSVEYDGNLLSSGNNAELILTLTNNASTTVNGCEITLSDDDTGSMTMLSDVIIPSGETSSISLYYGLSDNFSPHSISLTAKPSGLEDADMSDNTLSVRLDYDNLCLEGVACTMSDDKTANVSGNVVNLGYKAVSDVTVTLHKETFDGEVVESLSLTEQLLHLDLCMFCFDITPRQGDVYYVTIDRQDDNNADNTDFAVVVTADKSSELTLEVDKKITVTSSSDLTALLVVAFYDDDKMVSSKISDVVISEGANVFDLPEILEQADSFSVMLLENGQTLRPLTFDCKIKM